MHVALPVHKESKTSDSSKGGLDKIPELCNALTKVEFLKVIDVKKD